MTDIVDQQTRSRMMAGIRGKDTGPEMALRRAMHARGFRYKLHAKGLPGRPDLVLPKYRAVVFVHGCFWHRHPFCRYTSVPSTRPEFWQTKFVANAVRDNASRGALLAAGWRVATVWECAARKPRQVEMAANLLAAWLCGGANEIEIGETEVVAEGADG